MRRRKPCTLRLRCLPGSRSQRFVFRLRPLLDPGRGDKSDFGFAADHDLPGLRVLGLQQMGKYRVVAGLNEMFVV